MSILFIIILILFGVIKNVMRNFSIVRYFYAAQIIPCFPGKWFLYWRV